MTLKNVWCCCNYKVGIIIGGTLLMISSILYYYMRIEAEISDQFEGLRKAMIDPCFIVTISLVYGTVKEIRLFFLPWLVYEIFFIVLIYIDLYSALVNDFEYILLLIFILPRCALGIYYWIIIFRFWKLLDKKKISENQALLTQPSSLPERENARRSSWETSKENLSSPLAELSKNNKAVISNGYVLVLPNTQPNDDSESTYDYVANNLQHIYEFAKDKP